MRIQCRDCDLLAYVDGKLDTQQASAVEIHCQSCADCGAKLEALLEPVTRHIKECIDIDPVPQRVQEQIHQSRVPRRMLWQFAVPAVAACVAVFAICQSRHASPDSLLLSGKAFAENEQIAVNSAMPTSQIVLASGDVRLKLGDSNVVATGVVTMFRLRPGNALELLVGNVLVDEAKDSRNKVRILCQGREYVALGTRYSVDASDGLRVSESKVQAYQGAQSWSVGAGRTLNAEGEFDLLDNAAIRPGAYLLLRGGKLVEEIGNAKADSFGATTEALVLKFIANPTQEDLLETTIAIAATDRTRASEWVRYWTAGLRDSFSANQARSVLETAGSLLGTTEARNLATIAGGDFEAAVITALDQDVYAQEWIELTALQKTTLSELLLERANQADDHTLWRVAYAIAAPEAAKARDPWQQQRLWRVCSEAGFRSQTHRKESVKWLELLQAKFPTPAQALHLAIRKLEASAISDEELFASVEAALRDRRDYVTYERIIAALRIVARSEADWEDIAGLASWVAKSLPEVPAARVLWASIAGPILGNWEAADPILDKLLKDGEAIMLSQPHRLWIARRLMDRGQTREGQMLIDSCGNLELVALHYAEMGDWEKVQQTLSEAQTLGPLGKQARIMLLLRTRRWELASRGATELAAELANQGDFPGAASVHLIVAEAAPAALAKQHAFRALHCAERITGGWPVASGERDRLIAQALYYSGKTELGKERLKRYLGDYFALPTRRVDEVLLKKWEEREP
ncbi:MAG: hypothetical protein HONBIEJF_02361 [Fimbriimonadaceae bacterium]|nr:hypothetical protein [Fimbriimonadaceae bacterium]